MKTALQVVLAGLGCYAGSLVVTFVLALIGVAVAGRGGVTRAGHVMTGVFGLAVAVLVLGAVVLWVVLSRVLPAPGVRALVVGLYLVVLVPTASVLGLVLAVLFNR